MNHVRSRQLADTPSFRRIRASLHIACGSRSPAHLADTHRFAPTAPLAQDIRALRTERPSLNAP